MENKENIMNLNEHLHLCTAYVPGMAVMTESKQVSKGNIKKKNKNKYQNQNTVNELRDFFIYLFFFYQVTNGHIQNPWHVNYV